MGLREYYRSRWSANRLTRRTWFLLAAFGVVVAVLNVIAPGTLYVRVVLAALFVVYASICIVQGTRSQRRP